MTRIFTLFLGLAALASAETITSSCSIPVSTAPVSATCTLNTWNHAGTLTGITILETFNTSAAISVFNIGSVSRTFEDATASIPFTVSGPTGDLFSFNATAGPVSGIAWNGFSFTNPTVVFTPVSTTDSYINLTPDEWAAFTSPPSTVSLSVTSGQGIFSGSTDSPGELFFGGTAKTSGTLMVLYQYSPVEGVPEPVTMAMVGGGLLMLGIFKRK